MSWPDIADRAAPRAICLRRLLLVLFGACVTALAPTQAPAEPARPPERVAVRLNFLPGAEHAFLYLGRDKGWYAKEGIDLDVIPGQGSTVAVKTVGSGEDQFAIADTASVARGWEAGVPLVYVAMLLKSTPAAVFSLPSKNIQTLGDLCGKHLGINLKSTTAEQYRAMIRLARMTCTIDEIPMNSGGSKEVLAGLVDAAVNFSYTDALRVKLKNGGVNIIPARQYFDFFSLGIITNQGLLSAKPELVSRFVKVSLTSLNYALRNKDEALAAFIKVTPNADISYESAKFDAFKELLTDNDPAGVSIGAQTTSQWDASLKTLLDIGIIKAPMSARGKFIPLTPTIGGTGEAVLKPAK
jgi:NitT/TauT family transport system substrate-binding protein